MYDIIFYMVVNSLPCYGFVSIINIFDILYNLKDIKY